VEPAISELDDRSLIVTGHDRPLDQLSSVHTERLEARQSLGVAM